MKKKKKNRYVTVHFPSCLTLSAPQDVTNAIKTRSRLRVWVGRVQILMDFPFFFHGSTKKFNQLVIKKKKKILSSMKTIAALKFPKKNFFFLLRISLALKG